MKQQNGIQLSSLILFPPVSCEKKTFTLSCWFSTFPPTCGCEVALYIQINNLRHQIHVQSRDPLKPTCVLLHINGKEANNKSLVFYGIASMSDSELHLSFLLSGGMQMFNKHDRKIYYYFLHQRCMPVASYIASDETSETSMASGYKSLTIFTHVSFTLNLRERELFSLKRMKQSHIRKWGSIIQQLQKTFRV